MNAPAVIVFAIMTAVLLGVLAFVTLARRSDVRGAGLLSAETLGRDQAGQADTHSVAATAAAIEAAARTSRSRPHPARENIDPAAWTPPAPEALGVSRRQFFNRATISMVAAGLGTFSAASFVAFLWPTRTGGFGGKVAVGRIDDVRAGIRAGDGFLYAPEARAWITEYPAEALPKADVAYQPALLDTMRNGITIQYQKCPHLGCRVPQCVSSQWFECGCHGSQFNRVGEKKGGPAPRGMDHFAAEITPSGDVIIDTGAIWTGLPIGVNTTGQEAEGPHCVGIAEH
jgi:cytochrome b6-f complex iron-sulfur subunit